MLVLLVESFKKNFALVDLVGDRAGSGAVRASCDDEKDETETAAVSHGINGQEEPTTRGEHGTWVTVTGKKKGNFQRSSSKVYSSLVENNPVD